MKQEYWVMRVMLHQGKRVQLSLDFMTAPAMAATVALINLGEYALLPDNSIAEPVQGFDEECDSHALREKLARENPAEEFRVVMTMDVAK